MNVVCAGVHPQGGMLGGGCPRADPPHPRPAPLTELHQRVEEAGDRHQEVGEEHVLQLQLHGRATAGAWTGGGRQARRSPPPARQSASPAPAAAPPLVPPPSPSSRPAPRSWSWQQTSPPTSGQSAHSLPPG